MTNQYFGGVLTGGSSTAEEAVLDDDLKAVVIGALPKVSAKMEELRAADALTEIFALFKRCNKYIDETEPWKLAKQEDKKERLAAVLYHLADSIVTGASLLAPFLPETAEKIEKQFHTSLRSFDELDKTGLYPKGNAVTKEPEILFARQDIKKVKEKADEMYAARRAKQEKAAAYAPDVQEADAGGAKQEGSAADTAVKPEITYDDFAKLQFQVGEIIACEAVPKSKKLLCSQVKIGSQVKQIVSGIKAYYTPEEMVGKKVMVLVNLKPATLAGVISEGMLLCAENAEGQLALVTPEKDMPAGAEIC